MRALIPFIFLLLSASAFAGLSAAPSSQGSVPSHQREAERHCKQSSTINHPETQKCKLHFIDVRERKDAFKDFESDSARKTAATGEATAASSNADTGAQCALNRTLATAASEYNQLARVLATLEKQNHEQLLRITNYMNNQGNDFIIIARQMKAYAECARRQMRTHSNGRSANDQCALQHTITPEDRRAYTQELRGSLPALNLGRDTSQARALASFEEFKKIREEARLLGRNLGKRIGEVKKTFDSTQARRSEITRRYRCPASEVSPNARIMDRPNAGAPEDTPMGRPLTDDEYRKAREELKRHSTRMEQPDGRAGTGYFATTIGPDGKPRTHLVSAAHVGHQDWNDPMNFGRDPLTVHSAGLRPDPIGAGEFPVEPGQFDRANDTIVKPIEQGEGMRVVPAGTVPTDDQEFVMGGHPGIHTGGEYANMRCSFMGYQSGTGHYVMDCPTNNQFIGGYSGGPVVDKEGRVWGTVVQQGTQYRPDGTYFRDNRVFVSPIFNNPDGSLGLGNQRTFVAPRCYNVVGNQSNRCQIIQGNPEIP